MLDMTQIALEVGFIISSQYGQQEPKLMPTTDMATLKELEKAIKLHIKEWLESKKKSLPSEEMQQTYMLRRAYNSHIDNLITDLDCEGKNG